MDQNLPLFLLTVITMSLSGVLSPGPMTAAVIAHGARDKHSGLAFAMGHGAVEIPLIMLLSLGVGKLLEASGVRIAIGLVGGALLLSMGAGLLRPSPSTAAKVQSAHKSSFLAGMALSLGNPYFLLWWATVGLGLVMAAAGFGVMGVALLVVVHLACDFVWLMALSMLSNKGVAMLGGRFHRGVMAVCGAAMVFFGGTFIWGSIKLIIGSA